MEINLNFYRLRKVQRRNNNIQYLLLIPHLGMWNVFFKHGFLPTEKLDFLTLTQSTFTY
jgi:hypothetical protein